jgi:hypothetical protein
MVLTQMSATKKLWLNLGKSRDAENVKASNYCY